METLDPQERHIVRTIGKLSSEGQILVNERGTVLEANLVALDYFGERIVNRPLQNYLRHPDMVTAIEAGCKRQAHSDFVHKIAGTIQRQYRVQVSPFKPGFAFLLIENKSGVQSLDKARSEFVANVSHELRAPLTSLTGFVETLQGMGIDNRQDIEAQQNFLNIMAEETGRMTRLVNDLLSLSKVESLEYLQPSDNVDLLGVLEEVVSTLKLRADHRNVSLDIDVSQMQEASLIIKGERDALVEVFLNLVENAIKYCHTKTTVHVLACPVPENMVRIQVKNLGDGIEEQHIPRLTERFYRVDKARSRDMGGTGLGLAIVKHIVNRHQGRLQVSSEIGGETVFSVSLPHVS